MYYLRFGPQNTVVTIANSYLIYVVFICNVVYLLFPVSILLHVLPFEAAFCVAYVLLYNSSTYEKFFPSQQLYTVASFDTFSALVAAYFPSLCASTTF